jgi:hypothetical protein
MTLGLTTDRLKGDARSQNASYGFTVFSVMVPVIATGALLLVFIIEWLIVIPIGFTDTRKFLKFRMMKQSLC